MLFCGVFQSLPGDCLEQYFPHLDTSPKTTYSNTGLNILLPLLQDIGVSTATRNICKLSLLDSLDPEIRCWPGTEQTI
jgi:hypothetical protein